MWGSEGHALAVLGHGRRPAEILSDGLPERRSGRWLAVDDVAHGRRTREAAKPPQDFATVGVRGVRVAHLDAGPHGHDLSEHLDAPGPVAQEAAAGARRLIADEQHG